MHTKLRPYQQKFKQDIYDAWSGGHRRVMARLPTGGGKTKTFCSIALDMAFEPRGPQFPTAILVHRKELVSQISLTLAEEEIRHNIIAPRTVIQGIVAAQRQAVGRNLYDYNARLSVISVDTLIARAHHHEKWAKSIRFWIVDEAAHVLKKNKWGRALEFFPDTAVGLGVTATPQRLDKRGLGSHADGVFDIMVEGPGTRWLIDNDFLCNYRIAVPLSRYEDHLERASEGSDFTREKMRLASVESKVVGDVVDNYCKFAEGKQAIVFSDTIDTGVETEREFERRGIRAKLLTGETEDKVRLDTLIAYREKKIQVLLNVDLFDEGLDVPGIEAVIMARPTMSLGKYLQMIGRGLRYVPGKTCIIIDHVGNVKRHGLPCSNRKWTLDRIVKRQDKTNLIRICLNAKCNAPYDRILTQCPYCGTKVVRPEPGGGGRVGPVQVDGDLHLLDPEEIMQMEAACKLEDPADVAKRVSKAAGSAAGIKAGKDQLARIETQKMLVEWIAKWAGQQRSRGYTDRQIHKMWYLEHGRTITEALSEPRREMQSLIEQLTEDLRWYAS